MLITFHIINYFLNKILIKLIRNLQEKYLKPITLPSAEFNKKLIFDPPVYLQRYEEVYYIITNEKWIKDIKKLVDFGCAELQLFKFLKELRIEHLLFVDIDGVLLEEKIDRVKPLFVDHLAKRCTPLEVSVFQGSVSDPDYRLLETDVVTAIELIEHLYPNTLDALPYNIFHYMQPKLVLITTPNSDFNVHFGNKGFRHPDHKFEWSREQFEEWAQNIIVRFPNYNVDFYPIGKHPFRKYDLWGPCTQMAVFIRKDLLSGTYISSVQQQCQCTDALNPCKSQATNCKILCQCGCSFCLPDFSVGICNYYAKCLKYQVTCNDSLLYRNKTEEDPMNKAIINNYYKPISKVNYPYEYVSEEVKVINTLIARINNANYINSIYYICDKQRCEIPLSHIDYGFYDFEPNEIRNLLIKSGYEIGKGINLETGLCEDCIFVVPEYCEWSSSISNYSTADMSEDHDLASEHSENLKIYENIPLSDWDGEDNDDDNILPGHFNSHETSSSKSPKNTTKEESISEYNDSVPTDAKNNDKKDPDNRKNKKIDFNQLNELAIAGLLNKQLHLFNDRPNNDTSKPSPSTSPLKDMAMPGPSSALKKNRKDKKMKTIKETKVADVESPLNDSKSITRCIVYNSLNKIEDDCDIGGIPVDLIIEDLLEQEQDLDGQKEKNEQQPEKEEEDAIHLADENGVQLEEEQEEHGGDDLPIVENSDLANNNRDNEGNNFAANDHNDGNIEIDEGIDLLNDNVEEDEIVPQLEDNVRVNNNEYENIEAQNELVAAAEVHQADNVAGVDGDESDSDFQSPELEMASQEALVDINSEQDLLDDFDIPLHVNLDNNDSGEQSNAIFVRMNRLDGENEQLESSPVLVPIATSTVFPNWLLQLLNSNAVIVESGGPSTPIRPLPPLVAPENISETDFYCQGDGLGVHPSITALDIVESENGVDDDDEEDSSSSSDNTIDYAEVEQVVSDTFDTTTSEDLPPISISGPDRHNNSLQEEEEDDDEEEEATTQSQKDKVL